MLCALGGMFGNGAGRDKLVLDGLVVLVFGSPGKTGKALGGGAAVGSRLKDAVALSVKSGLV